LKFYLHQKHANSCHGTGDVYASVFTGALTKGKSLYEAACLAADFTADCIGYTSADPDHWYGVKFEPLLGNLIEMLK
jgi:pyridoxine kinase